jgi:hypothetical protein
MIINKAKPLPTSEFASKTPADELNLPPKPLPTQLNLLSQPLPTQLNLPPKPIQRN